MSHKWLTRIKPEAQQRLFCFPYAGGGASIYRQWVPKLATEIDVCPVQLPGRENRILDPAFTNIEALLPELANALQPHFDVPFLFFGHSMGALISFELARYLRRHQLPQPRALLLSAHRAPQLPYRGDQLHTMDDPEFMAALRELGGTPEAVLQHAELMEMLLPTLRTDFTLYETYQYQPESPFDYPLFIFGGARDSDVSVEELEAWREQTRGQFRLRVFPDAEHFFIHSHQDQLLRAILPAL